MWPDRVSNPGPLTYESGALPTELRCPARSKERVSFVTGNVLQRKFTQHHHTTRPPLTSRTLNFKRRSLIEIFRMKTIYIALAKSNKIKKIFPLFQPVKQTRLDNNENPEFHATT